MAATQRKGGAVDPAAQWREEAMRNLQRLANFATLAVTPTPPVGVTPREEVYRKGKARLFRYASARTRRDPLLFVPNLGLSRPYIFDLTHGMSFIEYMTGQGYDFFLLDWGEFGPEDRDLTIEECVANILPRVVRKVRTLTGAPHISVLGYCMGATLAACYLGSTPEAPVAHFLNLAGPIDFAQSGLFGLWLDRRFFNVDQVVDTFGELPVALVQAGMKMLKPTMDTSARLNLWWNLWNPEYVRGYQALSHWANDYQPMPGEFFREWARAFYQENRLLRGGLVYGGRPVRLRSITCPVLAVGAKEDHIVPPASARALLEAVGSRDTAYLELPGGHISLIAGRSAPARCWPRVHEWLVRRSQGKGRAGRRGEVRR